MNQKRQFLRLQILTSATLFLAILGCSNIIFAQDPSSSDESDVISPSNNEFGINGADYY